MKMPASMPVPSAALLAILLAGCGATSGGGPGQVNQSGFSTSFKQGYAEGCESADSRNRRRDESRYKTEADYMMGWNDGFSVCQRRR